jgi:2-pyrone-4,6-dicarboxylate lactonase
MVSPKYRVPAGGLDAATVLRWQPALRELGRPVELHAAVTRLDLRAWVGRFDVPVVIDHMGRPGPDRLDPRSTGLQPLLELVREGACHVKLSAPYRLSDGPAPWPDVVPLARALLAANPAACLWATDWPHTDTPGRIVSDDLVVALEEWCPAPAQRGALMARVVELYT